MKKHSEFPYFYFTELKREVHSTTLRGVNDIICKHLKLETFTIIISIKISNWNVFLTIIEESVRQTHTFLGHFKVKRGF